MDARCNKSIISDLVGTIQISLLSFVCTHILTKIKLSQNTLVLNNRNDLLFGIIWYCQLHTHDYIITNIDQFIISFNININNIIS